MPPPLPPTEVAILGGGLAAMHAAMSALDEGARVAMISSRRAGASGTSSVSMSVHRFATGLEPAGEYEARMADAGAGINSPRLLAEFTRRSPEIVPVLQRCLPRLAVRETEIAGRMRPNFASTPTKQGSVLTRALRQVLGGRPNVAVHDNMELLALEPSAAGWRVWLLGKSGPVRLETRAVVLATGGFPALFQCHSATPELLGAGLAVALRQGLALRDLEFVQFYPYRISSPRICDIFPEIFRHGARFLSPSGRRFMESYPRRELENRDVLARAIAAEGEARLDLSRCDREYLRRETPRLLRLWDSFPGEPLTVRPLAHFTMGGVATDADGFTGREGVYAAGEITGGLHGANRLAGHALSETVIFGRNAGRGAARCALAHPAENAEAAEPLLPAWLPGPGPDDARPVLETIRTLMWSSLGVTRSAAGMASALTALEALEARLASMRPRDLSSWLAAANGRLLARAAIRVAQSREESRGAHYREDFPEEAERFRGSFYCRGDAIWFEKSDAALP